MKKISNPSLDIFFISQEYRTHLNRLQRIWKEKYEKSWFIQQLKKKILELKEEEKVIEFGKTLKLDKGLIELFGNGQTLCYNLYWMLVKEGKL